LDDLRGQLAGPLSSCEQAPGLYSSLTSLVFGQSNTQLKCLCGTLFEPVDPNLACPWEDASPPPPQLIADVTGGIPLGIPTQVSGDDLFWEAVDQGEAFLDLLDGPCGKMQSMLDSSLAFCTALEATAANATAAVEDASKIALLNMLRSATELVDEILKVLQILFPEMTFQSERVDLLSMLNLTAEFEALALVEPTCTAAWRLQLAQFAWMLGSALLLLGAVCLLILLRKYELIFTLANLRVELIQKLDIDGDGQVTKEEAEQLTSGGQHFLKTVGSNSACDAAPQTAAAQGPWFKHPFGGTSLGAPRTLM